MVNGLDERDEREFIWLVSFNQINKTNQTNQLNGSYRFRKDVRDITLGCRENHASQEACSGSGLGFVHDSFEMLFDGVFAQMDPVRNFFIGKSEHEIHDDHLLSFGQVVVLLHIGVRAFERMLIQMLHDDEKSAVLREGFIRNTEPAKEEPLIVGKTEPLHLDRLAIFRMTAE